MNLGERRRPAMTRDLVLRAGLIWLAVSVIFVVTRWQGVAAMALPDADDTLRMVQVRDLLAGQYFWDLHQYRVDPPQGVLMHWSRLVDLPLAGVQLALRPLLGPVLAEHAALVIVPLLTLGAAILLVSRLAWRLVDPGLIGFACLVLALMTPVTGQMQPLRIDHHGWQIVAALAALNGLAARDSRVTGWATGGALALGMSISLEILPLAALFGGVLALRWLRDPRCAAGLIHFLFALALVGAASFLATHGLADLAQHCDAVSPAYLAALAVFAVGAWLLAKAGPANRYAIAAGLGATGLAGLAVMLWLAPACKAGPFATLDPLVHSFWYDNVHEGMPVWLQKPPVLAQMVVPPLLGLIGAAMLMLRSREWLRQFWLEYVLILAGTLILAVLVARASAFACAFAAVPLGWLLREWYRKAQRLRSPLARVGAVAAMVLAVMPGLPMLLLGGLFAGEAAASKSAPPQLVCDIAGAAPALNRYSAATIFAPIDIGPVLIAQTHHRVVATAHHRAPQALHDVIAAFIADPEAARTYVEGHGARFVLICPGLIEVGNYRQAAPHGLMARLTENRAPAWLRPVALPRNSGLMLWEVAPAQPGTKASASPFMQ